MNQTTYKLIGDKKPVGWQLPLKEILIKKGDNGNLQRVKFVPGVNSYFAEDIHKDLKPISIWFTHGTLVVPNVDKVKNALLQAHPWFNVKYKIYSKEADSLEKLEALRVSAEATRLIDESDTEKIRAIALGIFGQAAFNWDAATAELELRQYAKLKPLKLQKELKSKDYESKYLAALAFAKSIVREGVGKTSVIWNDTTKGVIMKLAKGESGIHKLGEFLSFASEESIMVVQEISARIDKVETKTTDKDLLADKDKQIKELKAQLGQKTTPSENGVKKPSIEEAREMYFKKYKKQVAVSKKNDLAWILAKLK